MSSLAILASLVMSVPAAANANDSMENKVVTALTSDEIGDGPVIELDVFSLTSGPTGTAITFFGTGSGAVPLIVVPAVLVGWEWDQNVALFGGQFIFTAGTGGTNGPVAIVVPATFRRYLKPVVLYNFVPFVEGSFDMDFIIPAGEGMSFGFGINAGFGGEYVFARNFGLFGKALLGYQHIPTSFNHATTNTDAFGIGGVLGIFIHF